MVLTVEAADEEAAAAEAEKLAGNHDFNKKTENGVFYETVAVEPA